MMKQRGEEGMVETIDKERCLGQRLDTGKVERSSDVNGALRQSRVTAE